jgi:hypothetical protein
MNESADDLEDLRKALGAKKISLSRYEPARAIDQQAKQEKPQRRHGGLDGLRLRSFKREG